MSTNTNTQERENNPNRKHHVIEAILIIIIILLLFAGILPFMITLSSSHSNTKDAELIRNLNTALKVDTQTTHRSHITMTDALDAAENAGYIVSKINAQNTNNEILWDSKNDAFVYYNDDLSDIEYIGEDVAKDNRLSVNKKEDVYYLWKICESKPTLNYSMYWIGEENNIPDPLTAGFDAGKNEVSKELNYLNESEVAQNVIIRTNSDKCVLNIDGPLDTVIHYGKAKTINIKRVAHHSYDERGEVGLISVDTGRIVLSEESNVGGVYFQAQDTDSDGYQDKFNKIIVQVKDGAELPKFYRDPVVIADEGTLVCKVESQESEEYIWLEKDGIYEQITVGDSEESINREWVSTSEATNDTKQVSQDIANVVDYNSVTIEEETREIIVDEGKTIEDVVIDSGKTQDEVEEIIQIRTTVSAYVEKQIVTTNDLAALYYNTDYADKAAVDMAYRFNAFSSEENQYVDAFINAKDENGKNIFTMNINDYNNEEKINKALAVVENELGAEARAELEELLSFRRPYFGWLADYEVSFDGDIDVGSVVLMGYYKMFADNFANGEWVGFGISGFENGNPVALKQNQSIRLLDTAYNVTHNPDFHMNYAAICGYVREFSCGFANLSDANEGVKITVTLKLYELDENGVETGKTIECGQYVETIGAVSAVNRELLKK